eukprot:scaffold159180_cov33-Tisochrysis_lutea.AAC.4
MASEDVTGADTHGVRCPHYHDRHEPTPTDLSYWLDKKRAPTGRTELRASCRRTSASDHRASDQSCSDMP